MALIEKYSRFDSRANSNHDVITILQHQKTRTIDKYRHQHYINKKTI